MSGVISVTPEELKRQARVYTQARDQVQDARDRVKRTNGEIASQWRGKAFESYLAQFEQLDRGIQQFNELLISIHGQLNKYADTIAARDAEDARAFGL